MTWAVTAVGVGTGLGAVASYLGAKKQANAANSASDQTWQQFKSNQQTLSPWVGTGGEANSRIAALLGIAPTSGPDWAAYLRNNPDVAADPNFANNGAAHYYKYGQKEGRFVPQIAGQPEGTNYGSLIKPYTGADLINDPGYQFGIQQGEQGINRAAIARGGYDSGATLKALTRFNQDYGGTKFNEGFGRDLATKNQTYNFLSGVSNTGANAAGQTAGLGANAANTSGQFLTQAGDANAAGIVGPANAINSGVGSYLGYQQNQGILDYLKNYRTGSLSSGASTSFSNRA